jgi:hypothetical protein
MVSHDIRDYWRSKDFWRWWWRNRVSGEAKAGIAVVLAVATGVAGFLSADGLSQGQESASLTTQRVVTIRNRNGPPKVVTQTVTRSGETSVVTIQRGGRTVVIPGPGETETVRGPERVVTRRQTDTVVQTETANRFTTVTTPGRTDTVTTQVTQPQRTVTETTTDRVTVTDEATVTDEVTVTATVTTQVTVTETGEN